MHIYTETHYRDSEIRRFDPATCSRARPVDAGRRRLDPGRSSSPDVQQPRDPSVDGARLSAAGGQGPLQCLDQLRVHHDQLHGNEQRRHLRIGRPQLFGRPAGVCAVRIELYLLPGMHQPGRLPGRTFSFRTDRRVLRHAPRAQPALRLYQRPVGTERNRLPAFAGVPDPPLKQRPEFEPGAGAALGPRAFGGRPIWGAWEPSLPRGTDLARNPTFQSRGILSNPAGGLPPVLQTVRSRRKRAGASGGFPALKASFPSAPQRGGEKNTRPEPREDLFFKNRVTRRSGQTFFSKNYLPGPPGGLIFQN